MKQFRLIILALFATHITVFAGCGSEMPSPRLKKNSDSSQKKIESAASSSETAGNETADANSESQQAEKDKTTTTDLLLAPEFRDPGSATLGLKRFHIESNSEWSTQVPVIEIQLGNADFAEVLRCKEGYQLTSPDGRPFEPTLDRELQQWAWIEASANTANCRMVSRRFAGPEFRDLASPSGNYFYILNPCFNESFVAPEQKSNCSFRLQVSKTGQVTASFKDLLRDKISAHIEAQATATGILGKLQYISQRITLNRELCEKGQIVEERSTNLWNGLVKLATLGLTSVVTSNIGVLPFVGAIDSRKVADLAVSIFGKKPKLPPSCSALDSNFSEAQKLSTDYDSATKEIEQSAKELSLQLQAAKTF